MPNLTALATTLPDTVPFVGPEAQERNRGRAFRARLGANESGFGPSPLVVHAMAEAAGAAWKYCDPENHDLKTALAHHLGVCFDNLVVGEGIDGLLGLTVRLFAEPGAAVVTSLGAYPTFNFHVAGFGARLFAVPYRGDGADLDALLAAARRERAAMVYLSNPDNPMGSWIGASDVERFADALPDETLLVLDEAYGETAPDGTLPPLLPLRPNTLRYRTFSKAYGLAGMRCGYAIGDASLIKAFEKVRNHFGVNRMAQVAGLAALRDDAFLAEVVGKVDRARRTIADIAASNGLAPLPSATNFVTIDCLQDGAFALRVLQQLIARDVFVRKPMAPGLDRCIRVSTGPDDELAIFAAELPAALAAARAAQA